MLASHYALPIGQVRTGAERHGAVRHVLAADALDALHRRGRQRSRKTRDPAQRPDNRGCARRDPVAGALDVAPLSSYIQRPADTKPFAGTKEGPYLRLFLTLLALLTGLAGADRAQAAPVTPAAMGTLVMLAESAAQSDNADKARRPADPDRKSTRLNSSH